ncbi:MAG: HAD-IIIA family hydrolase [Lentimicrobium sp.]|jgi:histidinol-phosphate phosphatase family protein|nr:HAD-IIIA family hydrolase [Lentimicrobium sp.]
MKLGDWNIDKTWTLFLDRDGVINKRLPGEYVQNIQQFEFIHGVPEAIQLLSSVFKTLVVVTNQQGIGKGLMSEDELQCIHNHMINKLAEFNGRIDKIYYSPYLESSHHISRKPAIGMGLMARRDFKDLKFSKSVMVGDSFSDMIFGKRLKMRTVFIGDPECAKQNALIIDFVFPDLLTFANSIKLNSPKA